MRNVPRLVFAVACAMASLAPRADAASLSLGPPTEVVPGWTRIAGHYDAAGAEPVFRALARCPGGDVQVLESLVHVAPADGLLWVDLPTTPSRLAPTAACDVPAVSIEMVTGANVVQAAAVSPREVKGSGEAGVLASAPPPPSRPARRLSLKGQRYGAPSGKRTEAGVEWALDSRVSIQLNYERTAQAPMMPFDHDDGILTRLRVGF